MKSFKIVFAFLLMIFLLAGLAAQAQDAKEGWSRKSKGAAIGGDAGAVTGLCSAAAKAL